MVQIEASSTTECCCVAIVSGWTLKGKIKGSQTCSRRTLSRTVLNGLSGIPNHEQNYEQNHDS